MLVLGIDISIHRWVPRPESTKTDRFRGAYNINGDKLNTHFRLMQYLLLTKYSACAA